MIHELNTGGAPCINIHCQISLLMLLLLLGLKKKRGEDLSAGIRAWLAHTLLDNIFIFLARSCSIARNPRIGSNNFHFKFQVAAGWQCLVWPFYYVRISPGAKVMQPAPIHLLG